MPVGVEATTASAVGVDGAWTSEGAGGFEGGTGAGAGGFVDGNGAGAGQALVDAGPLAAARSDLFPAASKATSPTMCVVPQLRPE